MKIIKAMYRLVLICSMYRLVLICSMYRLVLICTIFRSNPQESGILLCLSTQILLITQYTIDLIIHVSCYN